MKKLLLIFLTSLFVFNSVFVYAQFGFQSSIKTSPQYHLYNLKIEKISKSFSGTKLFLQPTKNFRCNFSVGKNISKRCSLTLEKSILEAKRIIVQPIKNTQFYLKDNEKKITLKDLKVNDVISVYGTLEKKKEFGVVVFYVTPSKIIKGIFEFLDSKKPPQQKDEKQKSEIEVVKKTTTQERELKNEFSTSLFNLKIIKIFRTEEEISPTTTIRYFTFFVKPTDNFQCFAIEKEKTECPKDLEKLMLGNGISIHLKENFQLYFKEMNKATITDFDIGNIINADGVMKIYTDNTIEVDARIIKNESKSFINLQTTKLASIPGEYYSLAESYYKQLGKKLYAAQFSPDGKKVTYAFLVLKRDYVGYFSWHERYAVVINGQEGKAYSKILADSITISPDGRKVAYVVQEGDNQFLVVNNEEGKRYDEILVNSIVFSPDSQKFAYIAKGKKGKKDVYFLVINNREGRGYDEISENSLMFSDDSKKITYMVREGDRIFSVVYHLEKDKYEQNVYSLFSTSQSAKLYSSNLSKEFSSEDEERQRFQIFTSFVMSSDGQKIAYVAEKEGKLWVMVNGEGFKGYDFVHSPIFSPDNKKLAYIAEERDEKNKQVRQFVVVNNKEGERFDWIYTPPQFTPDSKYLYYGARKGNEYWWIVEKLE